MTQFIRLVCRSLVAFVLGTGVALAVVDGEVDPNTVESPWAGVGSVTVGKGTYSGTLIAPNYVLTAAHVVGRRPPEQITFNLNLGGDLTHRIPAAEVFVHPMYRGVTGFQPGGEYDLAVIRLAEPAPAGVPIYPLYDDDLLQGSVITFVGYGGGGMGAIGTTENPDPAVKRVGSNVAECFAFTMGPDNCDLIDLVGNGPRAVYLYDFDAPPGPGQRQNGRLPIGESSLAGGDSGSGTFVFIQGQWRLAAVNTFVTRAGPNGKMSVFGTAGGGVLLSGANGDWVKRVLGDVSPPPALDTGMKPGVPEPRSWFLLLLGLSMVTVAVWRQWRAHRAG